MGDWNFATCHHDRIFHPTYQYTGDNDKEEAKNFVNLLAKPCGFRELQQEEYTFHGGPERWDSRIDRIYSNSHLADVQDKDISCFRTNYKSRISDHSPVAFIVAAKHKRDNVNTIPDWVCKHPTPTGTSFAPPSSQAVNFQRTPSKSLSSFNRLSIRWLRKSKPGLKNKLAKLRLTKRRSMPACRC